MAWSKEDLDVFLRRNVMPRVQSTFATTKPLLWIMVGRDKAQLEKLGDPSTGLLFGGRDFMGEATRRVVTGSEKIEVVYQKDQTPQGETVPYQATSLPTQGSGFAEDNFGTTNFKWADYWWPFRFSQHAVVATEGNRVRIDSIVELSTQQAVQRMLELIQTDLWTGDPTDATNSAITSPAIADRLWAHIVGLQNQVDDGSNYTTHGDVDRTVETELQAFRKSATAEVTAGNLPDTKIRLDLIRKAKLDYGLTNKYAGAGDFWITGPDMFSVLVDEAESRNLRVIDGGIPEIGMDGFRLPIIQYGSSMVTYDPDCPDGELYGLTSRSWTFEIGRGANFQMEGNIHEKWKEQEGGGYYNWGHFHTKARSVCHEPHLQFKYEDLTTDGS